MWVCKMGHDWDGYEKPGYMGEESTKLCVSAFLSYIFTMWKFVNVTVYAMQQYHFTLTVSTRMSQELWIGEICTDQLVRVAPRKVCTERSIPLLTYWLTPWCRVVLEKLTDLQPAKKFPAFHGTRRFITALTSICHLSLSWASPVQSIYPPPADPCNVM